MTATTFTHHTMPIQQVEQILFGARDGGAEVAALLQRADISPALFASPPSRVTQAQHASLIFVLRQAPGEYRQTRLRER